MEGPMVIKVGPVELEYQLQQVIAKSHIYVLIVSYRLAIPPGAPAISDLECHAVPRALQYCNPCDSPSGPDP